MEWSHNTSPKLRKFCIKPSLRRLSWLIWDEWRVILQHYMHGGETVTGSTYVFLNITTSILQSCQNSLDFWVHMFCYNLMLSPHIVHVTVAEIWDVFWMSSPSAFFNRHVPKWVHLKTAQGGSEGQVLIQVRPSGDVDCALVVLVNPKFLC